MLNVRGTNDVRQTEINIAEPLLSDQISEELNQARSRILHSEIQKIFRSFWNKEVLS
jgi:hypothetical protein